MLSPASPLLALGSQRRRLIPALSLDTPSPVRKTASSTGVRWVDGPLRSTQRGLGEPFEIKVYEIDDVERLQRRRGGASKVRPLPSQGSQFLAGPALRTSGEPSQAQCGQWVAAGLWDRRYMLLLWNTLSVSELQPDGLRDFSGFLF